MMTARLMASASNRFYPRKISSLVAWYDASDITTITKDGSDLVSAWNDKSGNAYHLSAAGGARPTWVNTQLNNRPTLDFNGSSNTFALPSGLYGIPNGSNTVFAVCKTDVNNALQVIVGLSEAGLARWDIRYTANAGEILFLSRTTTTNGVTKSSVSDTSYGLLMGRRSGTTQAIAFNSSSETTNSNGADENGCNAGYVGSFLGSSFFLNGQIAEILIFNASLSAGNITLMNTYLSKKWGV